MKHALLLGLGLLATSGRSRAQAPVIVSVSPAAKTWSATQLRPVRGLWLWQGRGSFNSGGVQQVGLRPVAIALGNLDGDSDFVTANDGDATLSVALKDGRGQFPNSAGQTLAAGANPAGLPLGDLDADSDLNVVVTAAGAGTLACYLSSGQGRFSAGQMVTVGQQLGLVLLGDFDGDQDFAVANGGRASLTLGLHAGNATSAGPTLATGAQPLAAGGGRRGWRRRPGPGHRQLRGQPDAGSS